MIPIPKIMAEKIAEQGRKEFDELAGDLGDRINDMLNRAKSDHEVRIASLEERIRVLETAMAEPPSRNGEP